MQITIENQTFTVTEDSERLTITDAKDNVIGVANDMQSATAICEQIAWRRRVDGKVDEMQKAVDGNFDEGAIQKSFIVCKCMDCVYYRTFYTNQITTGGDIVKVGYCSAIPNQYTTVSEDYSCDRAKRRM